MSKTSSTDKQGHHETAPAVLTHRFAKFNPFRSEEDEGGEELGEDLTNLSVAGGGRGTFGGAIEERKKLNVSHALRDFLKERGEIGPHDVGGKDDRAPVSTIFKVSFASIGNQLSSHA